MVQSLVHLLDRHPTYRLQNRPTKPGRLTEEKLKKGPPVPPARHPRYHLKEKLNTLVNKIINSARDIHDEIQFIKKVPRHPRDRLKRKVKAIENNINIIKEIKTIPPNVKKSAEALEDEVQFI